MGTDLQRHERNQSGGGGAVSQTQRDVVPAQQPPTVHRTHVGRRRPHHFDETAHGRGPGRAGQRVASLVAARRGRVVGAGHLTVRGGHRRPERRRRKRFLRCA